MRTLHRSSLRCARSACWRAARTCTTSRARALRGRAPSSRTAAPRARWWPGTVARGQLVEDEHLHRGTRGGSLRGELPLRRSTAPTARARARALRRSICAPCHGRVGRRRRHGRRSAGCSRPPSLHLERLREAPPGYFFDVITNGFGAMFDFADRIDAARSLGDHRLRAALQLSQPRHARRRAERRARASRGGRVSEPCERASSACSARRPRPSAPSPGPLLVAGAVPRPRRSSSRPGSWPSSSGSRCALGSLALVMLHHLTGGAWGLAVRRLLEASLRTLPLLALLFLPICARPARDLYPGRSRACRARRAARGTRRRT